MELKTIHDYNGQKTQVIFKWEPKQLKIEIGDYAKTLTTAQVEVFKVLLEHLFEEKLLFQSSKPKEELKPIEESATQPQLKEAALTEISKTTSTAQIAESKIEGVFYEFETAKAVCFGREEDDKVLWIPKSVIQGSWETDKSVDQNIELKYVPRNFGWQERKKK